MPRGQAAPAAGGLRRAAGKFLEAIRDPGHEEHEAMLEWVGGSFDAEAFDLTAVNRALIALSFGRGQAQ